MLEQHSWIQLQQCKPPTTGRDGGDRAGGGERRGSERESAREREKGGMGRGGEVIVEDSCLEERCETLVLGRLVSDSGT